MNLMDQDRPSPYSVASCIGYRSPVSLEAVWAQFNVATAQRYKPQGHTTYCATYATDGAAPLGVILPTVWGVNGRVGTSLGPDAGFCRLRANDLTDWVFGTDGKAFGWNEVDSATASQRASCGFPTFALYFNPNGDGHIAGVLPALAAYPGKVIITQAGLRCFHGEPLENGFGSDRNVIPVRFATHD